MSNEEPKYIAGDTISFREETWKVILLSGGRYNLDCLSDVSKGQLSIKTWRVDRNSEAIKLVDRKKKLFSKSTKDSKDSSRKDKWWQFW